MKTKLRFVKSLLVMAALCLGSNAWGAPTGSNVLSTMTGIVGPTDNSSAAFTYGSKVITIAAGETYELTFVNYNAGSGNKWNNWILEGNNGSLYFDFRADGGYWGGIFEGDAPAATNSYSGSTHTSVSGLTTDVDDVWMAAYNGVTVTLTATRSDDGATLTFAHSATTNTSVAYSGTFTVNLTDASSTINFYITNEASHQLITDVTYTRGTEGTIYTRSVHTAGAKWGSGYDGNYESTVDAAAEFYNTTTTKWMGAAYAKFAYSLPASVTVLSATLTYNTNQGGSSARTDKISYMAKDFDIDWANFAGQKNVDLSYSSYRNDAVTVATGGIGVRTNLKGDVTDAVRAIYAENQNFILFQWSENAGAANLYGNGATDYNAPQLEINYTTATTYSYAVKAKDGAGNLLKELTSGIYIEGDPAITIAYPQFILSGTDLYEIANNGSGSWYGTTFTPDAANYEKVLTYNKQTIANVVFYAEAENLGGFAGNSENGNITARSSGGRVARSGAYKALTTLGMGKYKIYARAFSDGKDGRNMTVKAGETEVFSWNPFPNSNNGLSNSDEFNLYTSTALTIIVNGNSTAGLDWIYIVRTGEPTVSKTISAAGWATYCSPYALDLTGAITNLDDAFIVTGGAAGVLTKTSVMGATVPANTGLLLKGKGDCTIPVVASGTADVAANKLKGVTSNTEIAANAGYVLMGTPSLGFYQNSNAFTVGANTAYLPADFAGAGARTFFQLDGETTGINAIENAETVNGIYNLAGQRVAQPTRGLYIVNGKKIVVK